MFQREPWRNGYVYRSAASSATNVRATEGSFARARRRDRRALAATSHRIRDADLRILLIHLLRIKTPLAYMLLLNLKASIRKIQVLLQQAEPESRKCGENFPQSFTFALPPKITRQIIPLYHYFINNRVSQAGRLPAEGPNSKGSDPFHLRSGFSGMPLLRINPPPPHFRTLFVD